MNILVTGADGFLGKNFIAHLDKSNKFSTLSFTRKNSIKSLFNLVEKADAVIHLAGENRPIDDSAFNTVNADLTQTLCDAIRATGRKISLKGYYKI